MSTNPDYININRNSWNKRTEVHVNSEFYDMPGFLKGNTSLMDIELKLLGDVRGKKILHLQCHFGQDSISLQRMGAQVTAVDLSDTSVKEGRLLAQKTNMDVTFVCCDVYDLPNHLNDTFDMVYTSYGTIGWLPDLDKWAAIISQFLKPGGKFVFAEFHPVVWMFDADFEKITYRYFNSGPIIETESGTYADKNADIQQEYVGWNHGLGEVLGSLLNNGLQLTSFEEFDYSPYNCFNATIEVEPKKYRIKHLDNNIPMVYALVAEKR